MLRENTLRICYKIMRVGAHERHVSCVWSFAIGSFVLFSIRWWTITKKDKECGSGVQTLGLRVQLTPPLRHELCDLGRVTPPHCASWLQLSRGDDNRTFLQGLFWKSYKGLQTLPAGTGPPGKTGYPDSVPSSWQVYYNRCQREGSLGFGFVLMLRINFQNRDSEFVNWGKIHIHLL